MKFLNWKTKIKPRFPKIVEKFLSRKNANTALGEEEISIIPSVNISDANKAFGVNVALPGLDKKDIKIEVQDNYLVISSENKNEHEEKNANWIRKEYSYSSFRRIFELPESADVNRIKANLKNGILSVNVAKKNGYKPKLKTITVE